MFWYGMKIVRVTFLTVCVLLFFHGISFSQNFSNWDAAPKQGASASATASAGGDLDEITLSKINTLRNSLGLTEEEASKYTLGKTDVIEVTVLRHPEVSGSYVINNEGKIQYEFIGDIKIAGLTKDEAKEVIQAYVAEFIINPEVMVKITGYNSKVVYVIGEVGSPGKIFMRGDTITVREALLDAGLPLLSASTKKTRLITPADNGKALVKNVDVHKLLYEGDLRENLVMTPGDTLYIPATIWAKTLRAIQPVAQPIGTAAGTGRTVMTGF